MKGRRLRGVLRLKAGSAHTKAYDLFTASPLIAWYVFGLVRQVPLTSQRMSELVRGEITLLELLQLVALLGSFVLIFLLIYLLFAREVPHLKTEGGLPRMVAFCGTFAGNGFLYLKPMPLSLAVQILADVLIIAGAAGSFAALFRLGGAFSLMPEARKLVTDGPYALVRHPLYVAELIGVSGLVLQFQQPYAVALGACVFALQYWRTVYEERVLSAAYPEYVAYRSRTGRFLPHSLRRASKS
jgi:protein-S-isoprenylcysteine O-methyltransferase Ste14